MSRHGAFVITGAASGIGRALACLLAGRGERLVLWDRDEAGLTQTAQRCGKACLCAQVVDVTDPEATTQVALRTAEAVGSLSDVIHCAGILRVGAALSVSAADYRAMMEVNYLGSVHVTQALVPHLLQSASVSHKARLSLVASVAGLRAVPTLAGYSASKYAVVGFGRALADELYDRPIEVRVICPPAVDTPMVRNLPALPPVYRLSPPQSVDAIAEAMLDGLERPGFPTLLDLPSKLMWGVERTAPKAIAWALRRMSR